jgi:hypothetical protein
MCVCVCVCQFTLVNLFQRWWHFWIYTRRGHLFIYTYKNKFVTSDQNSALKLIWQLVCQRYRSDITSVPRIIRHCRVDVGMLSGTGIWNLRNVPCQTLMMPSHNVAWSTIRLLPFGTYAMHLIRTPTSTTHIFLILHHQHDTHKTIRTPSEI